MARKLSVVPSRKPRFGTEFATSAIEEHGIVGYEASRRVAAEPIDWVWSGIIARHHRVSGRCEWRPPRASFASHRSLSRAPPRRP
jgi:hypothetical protein